MTAALFVFRRYGLAVPISIFVIGLLLQTILDKQHGGGYYASHLWAIGLNLLLSGIVTGIISCIVECPPSTGGGSYSSLLNIGDGFSEKVSEVGNDLGEHLDHFFTGASEDDAFCYVPLNRCAMALMAVGSVLIIMGVSGVSF